LENRVLSRDNRRRGVVVPGEPGRKEESGLHLKQNAKRLK
jgi:hypothetical protein